MNNLILWKPNKWKFLIILAEMLLDSSTLFCFVSVLRIFWGGGVLQRGYFNYGQSIVQWIISMLVCERNQ